MASLLQTKERKKIREMWRIGSSIVWIEEAVSPEICCKPKENEPCRGCLRLRNIGWPASHLSQQINPVNPPISERHIAFADVTGAKKIHRLLKLQNFLTGSMQRVKIRINSSQLICWAAWWNGNSLKSVRKRESKLLIWSIRLSSNWANKTGTTQKRYCFNLLINDFIHL